MSLVDHDPRKRINTATARGEACARVNTSEWDSEQIESISEILFLLV